MKASTLRARVLPVLLATIGFAIGLVAPEGCADVRVPAIQIADTSTLLPGINQTFPHFDAPSSNLATNPPGGAEPCGLRAAFRVEGAANYRGIYQGLQSLQSPRGTQSGGPLSLYSLGRKAGRL